MAQDLAAEESGSPCSGQRWGHACVQKIHKKVFMGAYDPAALGLIGSKRPKLDSSFIVSVGLEELTSSRQALSPGRLV